ncbi:APA family basic amino acid/polyamine antiporter [Aequitasia blattaphilus]|uniref:Amino acid permease n=1 Tax=Aequitasia blattaphilus TaxID=2949332 RepID=A0ABT1E5M1_9FIRM|nr:amino acid permease [Aequitasia blattaphilus]MCP1101149.1 amino acid permease [Aequitasia blattaphilus]MCR8613789.1 amino acid permease [Aequitasia blattaphilus]
MEKKKELKKNLGVATATATVVGSVIGSGVFFKPQAIYTATGGAPGLGMIAWIITGLASIAAALTFAEVAIMIPKTGGIVAYLEKIYSPKVGFLAGWVQTLLFYPAMIAALAVAFAQQAALFIGEGYIVPVAILVIITIMLLNNLGSKVGGSVQVIFTVCKLIPLILLMVFGFVRGGGNHGIFTPMIGDGLNPTIVLGQLMVAILFAFEGWTNVGAIAGEMKKPGRDLPIAIVGGVSVIMAVYFVINIAYLFVLPSNELATLSAPASAVAIKIFGDIGGKIISVGIMVSVFGSCNGFVLSGSRVAYSLASEGNFPFAASLAKLNKAQVPTNSILLVGGIGALYAVSGQFNLLTDLAIIASWTFYTLTFIGVMKLRKDDPHGVRTYKVPLYPLVPIVAIVSGIFVIINQLFLSGLQSTLLSLGSIGVIVIGIPVYASLHKKRKELKIEAVS